MNRFEKYVRAWMQSVEQWEQMGFLERATGLEPATSTLGKLHSTS